MFLSGEKFDEQPVSDFADSVPEATFGHRFDKGGQLEIGIITILISRE